MAFPRGLTRFAALNIADLTLSSHIYFFTVQPTYTLPINYIDPLIIKAVSTLLIRIL